MEAADLAQKGEKLGDLLTDADPAVRFWGATGCIAQGEKARPHLEILLKMLQDPAPNARIAAAEALSRLGRADDAIPVLAKDLKHESEWIRLPAALALEPLAAKSEAARAAFKAVSGEKTEYVKRILDHALGTSK